MTDLADIYDVLDAMLTVLREMKAQERAYWETWKQAKSKEATASAREDAEAMQK